MLLENECSDLKEKLENLLKDFGNLKAELQSNDSNEHNTTKEAIKVSSELKLKKHYFQNKNLSFHQNAVGFEYRTRMNLILI
jgi:hypothetical protein